MRIPPELILTIADYLAWSCLDLACMARSSKAMHSLVTPTLYAIVQLETDASARAFQYALTQHAALGRHVRLLVLGLRASVVLAEGADVLASCVNLETVQLSSSYAESHYKALFDRLCRTPVRRLAMPGVGLTDSHGVVMLLRQHWQRHALAGQLRELHISAAQATARLWAHLDLSILHAVERLSLTVQVKAGRDVDAWACRFLQLFLLDLAAVLPRVARIRVFLFPSDVASLLRGGQFIDNIRATRDRRVSIASVDQYDTSSIFLRDQRGETSMWDVGDDLITWEDPSRTE